jgi:hypothetical protein
MVINFEFARRSFDRSSSREQSLAAHAQDDYTRALSKGGVEKCSAFVIDGPPGPSLKNHKIAARL